MDAPCLGDIKSKGQGTVDTVETTEVLMGQAGEAWVNPLLDVLMQTDGKTPCLQYLGYGCVMPTRRPNGPSIVICLLCGHDPSFA